MKKQAITIGLCEAHLRRKRLMGRLALVSIVAGLSVFLLGLRAMIASNRYYGHQVTTFPAMAMIGGPIVGILLALLFSSRIWRLRLISASNGWLRISGVSEGFLKQCEEAPKKN